MLPGQSRGGHIMAPPCPADPLLCPLQAWPARLTHSASSTARRAHGVSNCVPTAPSLALPGVGAPVLPWAFFSTPPSPPTAAGIKVKCMGSPGHGSRFISNTAAEKMVREGLHPAQPPTCPGAAGHLPAGLVLTCCPSLPSTKSSPPSWPSGRARSRGRRRAAGWLWLQFGPRRGSLGSQARL